MSNGDPGCRVCDRGKKRGQNKNREENAEYLSNAVPDSVNIAMDWR